MLDLCLVVAEFLCGFALQEPYPRRKGGFCEHQVLLMANRNMDILHSVTSKKSGRSPEREQKITPFLSYEY
jgi:hypothetical protein